MEKKICIAIGADHRGFVLKQFLIDNVRYEGHSLDWIDVGAYDEKRSDYPEFALPVVNHILNKNAHYGLLLCGSGNGMVIVANRFPKIYAGLAWNQEIARLCKEDDKVNVLVLPADFIDFDQALSMVHAWLHADFKHDRYEKRIAMIDAIKV